MSSPSTSEPHHENQPPGEDGKREEGRHAGDERPDDGGDPATAQPGDESAEESSAESTAESDDATDAEQPADDQKELTLDLVFEILKNSRRREVLRYLKERREQVTLSELAEHVAAIENDTTVQALSSQQRKRVYVGLYQCHLPKLDDMDVVEFNQSRGHVELGPNAEQLDKYLYMDEDDTDQRPWYQYYLGVSAVGALVLVGIAATGALGPTGVVATSVGVVLSITALAAVHAYDTLD